MVDLHELEQRWLRYKIKYYLPHFAVTISIIVITSTLIIYNKNFSKEIRKKETKKKQIEKKVALQTSIPIKKKIKKKIKKRIEKKTPLQRPMRSIAINKKAVVHSPSLDIMKKSPTQMQPHDKDKNISTQDINISAQDINISAQDKNISTQDKNISTQDINISTQDKNISIQDINISTQDINISTQDINISTQDINITAQDINISTQDKNISTQDINISTQDINISTQDINITIQDKKNVKDTIQREQTNTLTPVETPLQKEEPHHISIIKKDTHNDIVEIIQRFNKNNNPALSLFIAEKYYALGNYRQSRHYALITNNLNKDIELSWIIFTKSLVKLGERKKAIQTLQKYLEYNHSNRVQTLLNKIRSGKLK